VTDRQTDVKEAIRSSSLSSQLEDKFDSNNLRNFGRKARRLFEAEIISKWKVVKYSLKVRIGLNWQ
jgi:hypothetical protein